MSDETTATSGTAIESQTTQATETASVKTFTQEEVNRLMAKELKPLKEVKSEYEKLLAEKQKQKDAELTELEKLQKRIGELEPYESQAKEYESELSEIVAARIALIPEDKKSLVPEYSSAKLLKWLDANEKLLFGGLERPSAPQGGRPPLGTPDTLMAKAEEKVRTIYAHDRFCVPGSDKWKAAVERIYQELKQIPA